MLGEWREVFHGCDLSRLSLLVHTVSLQARQLRDPRAACHELKDFALGVWIFLWQIFILDCLNQSLPGTGLCHLKAVH